MITNAREIIDAADIVDVIGRRVQHFRQQGRQHVGRCPFHGSASAGGLPIGAGRFKPSPTKSDCKSTSGTPPRTPSRKLKAVLPVIDAAKRDTAPSSARRRPSALKRP